MPAWKWLPRGPNPSPSGASTGQASAIGHVAGARRSAAKVLSAGDAVRAETRPALETSQRAVGVEAQDAVDRRGREAVPREQELQRRDVPARGAAGQRRLPRTWRP